MEMHDHHDCPHCGAADVPDGQRCYKCFKPDSEASLGENEGAER